MKDTKHSVSQTLSLEKCPDSNAFIRVQVTASFVSEC